MLLKTNRMEGSERYLALSSFRHIMCNIFSIQYCIFVVYLNFHSWRQFEPAGNIQTLLL
jgi:hypothetical protein